MSSKNTLSREQCRGARAMLGISRAELAELAQVGEATLADFEGGKRSPYPRTLADIRAALEARGATFVSHDDRAGVLIRMDAASAHGEGAP